MAYSHETFPLTICWSVCLFVQCIVTKWLIGMDAVCSLTVGQMGPGMRQVVEFGNLSMGGGNFWG